MNQLPKEVSNLLKDMMLQNQQLNWSCWVNDNKFFVELVWDKVLAIDDDGDSDVEIIGVDQNINDPITIDSDVEIIDDSDNERPGNKGKTDQNSNLLLIEENKDVKLDDNNNITDDALDQKSTIDNKQLQCEHGPQNTGTLKSEENSLITYSSKAQTSTLRGNPPKRPNTPDIKPDSNEPPEKIPKAEELSKTDQTPSTSTQQDSIPGTSESESLSDTEYSYPPEEHIEYVPVAGRRMSIGKKMAMYAMQRIYPDKSDFTENGTNNWWEKLSSDKDFFDVFFLKINSTRYRAKWQNYVKNSYVLAAECFQDEQVINFDNDSPSVDDLIAQRETIQEYVRCLFYMRSYSAKNNDSKRVQFDVVNYKCIAQIPFLFLRYMYKSQNNTTVRIPRCVLPREMLLKSGLVTLNRAKNLYNYIISNKFAQTVDAVQTKKCEAIQYKVKALESLEKLVDTVVCRMGGKL